MLNVADGERLLMLTHPERNEELYAVFSEATGDFLRGVHVTADGVRDLLTYEEAESAIIGNGS